MAERALVTSVDAVESFRADLIVFLTRTRAVLEEANDEVLRTRLWVQNDQRRIWEEELRRRARKLEEAQAELFSARLSKFHGSTSLQIMAVQRAERSFREAEEKIAALKKWGRELENLSDPLVKQISQFHGFLTTDMARATAYLWQVVRALEAYAEVSAPAGSVTAPPVAPAPEATETKNHEP